MVFLFRKQLKNGQGKIKGLRISKKTKETIKNRLKKKSKAE